LKVLRYRESNTKSENSIMRNRGGQMLTLVAIFLVLILSGCSSEYQEVHITIEDFRFSPANIQLSADQPIRVVVRNQGREPHRFKSRILSDPNRGLHVEMRGLAFDREQGVIIPPGKSIELIFALPVGIYHFQCPIRGHRGMRGLFDVKEAGRESSFSQRGFATCLHSAWNSREAGLPLDSKSGRLCLI